MSKNCNYKEISFQNKFYKLYLDFFFAKMEKKGITKSIIFLSFISLIFLIFILIFIVSGDNPSPMISTKFTSNTHTSCIDNKCTSIIYSLTKYAQNSSGDWVDASDVLKITKNSGDLTFHYNGIYGDLNITFEAGVIYNGNYFSMIQIKQLFPQIEFDFPVQVYPDHEKYAVNISKIPSNVQPKIQNITLTYKDHNGFALSELDSKKGRYIVKELIELGFDDLKENGFIFQINKNERRIYIGNLTFINNSLYLDPTLTLTAGNITEDGYINFDGGATYTRDSSATTFLAGYEGGGVIDRAYIEFNTNSIPDNAVINSVKLNVSVSEGSANTFNITEIKATVSSQSDQDLYTDIGNGTTYSNPTYTGLTSWVSTDISLANTTLQSQLNNNWFAVGIKDKDESNVDTASIQSFESVNDSQLIVTYTLDTVYPVFSNYWDNNNSVNGSGIGLFNVTLANTNGTVWLEINNTNITATNITANVYNASYSFTGNGTYSYKWHSWGNGGARNYNVSNTRSYFVNPDTTAPGITILSPLNTTYVSSAINFSISSNENLSFCSVSLNNWVKNYTMTINASGTGANYTNTSIADGSYTSKFWCNDSSGNINNTEQVTFSIDTTLPALLIVYPLNITYNINVSQLNYTSNGAYCWYSNGTGAWNSTPVSCGTNWTNVVSIEGSNTWTLYANDSVGNLNLTNVTFSKDTIYPLIEFAGGTASDNSNFSRNWIYLNVSWIETNFANITFNLYNSSSIVNSTTYTTADYNLNLTSLSDKIYYYNATIYDTANNKNSTGTRTIRLDTTPPTTTASATSPPGGASYTFDTWTKNNVRVTLTGYDSGVGFNNLLFPVYCNDSANACSPITYIGSGATISGEGTSYVRYYSNDTLNNNESVKNQIIKIDKSPPNLTILYPIKDLNLSINTSISLNYTATDSLSGINLCWFNLDNGANTTLATCQNTTFNTSEGTHTVYVYANDSLNNVNNSQLVNFTIDLTNPLINYGIGAEIDGLNKSRNWIYVNVSVTETNFRNITFLLYNSTGQVNSTTYSTKTYFINWTSLPNGIYYYNASVRDIVNRANATTTRTIRLDTTYPQISYNPNTDSNGTYKSIDSIFINITASDSFKDIVQFEFNGANETFDNSSGDYYWENKTGLSEGTYNFYAWANDSANNFNKTDLRTIYIDLTSPVITIINPKSQGYNTNTSLSLNYTATDSLSGINLCWFNLDNGANTTLATCQNTTFNTSEGTHTVYVYANDSVGRVGSSSVSFTVSLGPPTITINYPSNGSWLTSGQNVNFNYTPSDTDLGSCDFWINSTGTWHLNQTNSTPSNNSINTFQLTLPDSSYKWNIKCNDTGNNFAWASPLFNYTLNIDSLNPLISFSSGIQANDTNTTNTWVYANVSVTEINENTITFLIYNSTGQYNKTSYTNKQRTINWTSLPDGIYYYNVSVNDSSGRSNSTETRTIRLDDTLPSLTVYSPLSQNYGNNNSLSLNYSATDNFIGLSECWYYVQNSSGSTIIPTETLSTCENDTFALPGGDINYDLYLFAKDILENIKSVSVNFGIRTNSPAIVLYPVNNSFSNHLANNSFNFTVTTNGINMSTCELWGNFTGNWSKNQTLISVTNGTTHNNFSLLDLSESEFSWNVWCNDSFNNNGWALNNITFITDITPPIVNITSIDTSENSQTITFYHQLIEPHSNNCWYSIFDSFNLIDGLNNNVSVVCNNSGGTNAVVSEYDTFTLRVYANDSASNQNSSSKSFTTSTTPIREGGGGESQTKIRPFEKIITIEKITTVTIIKPKGDDNEYTEIDRAKIYKVIKDFYSNKSKFLALFPIKFAELSVLQNQLDELGINMDIETLRLWIDQYNENRLENVEVDKKIAEQFGLVTAILEFAIAPFEINPKRVDSFFLLLSSDSIYEFIVKSNKRLDSSNIVEGELGLSSETISEETTSKLRYSPQNLDFSIKTVKGIVNYLSKDGESVFQDINLRVINLTNPMVIIVLIIAIIQILILSLFRKQIISQFNNTKIFFSKIFKKKKSQISVKRYLILGFIVISLVVFFQFVFSASINYPLNNTLVYGESVILNWTVNITNANVWVYGSNNLSRINGSLLFFNQSVPLGNYTYNWTNPTIFDGDDGLTGLFRFNNDTNLGENNTWFVDSSTWDSITTNAICGTNCPNFTEGKFGKALNITNKSVYILDNNEIDGTGVYTVMFWFQYSGAGTATCYSGTNGVYVYPLVVKGTGEAESATQDVFMLIGINQSSRLCNDYEDGINSANHPACGATTIQQDQWYHGAVVVNGTNNVIYLNGIRDGISSNVSNPRTTTIQRIGIGQCYLSTNASTGNAGGNYRGLIEEIAFYNKSMTASEINSYYNLSYGQYYWAVNQTNSTDTDYSGIYTFNLTQDTIYPLFSTYWDNNASLIISGTGLFNVTLTNTNGTVLFEINNVIVAILTPSNYVYKSFCSELNNFDFKLMPVTKAYSSLQQGREIYFLDSENKPVRIKSITKENNYTGRIYDVDVSNDIVLVRRNNNGNFGSAVWSGNSNREDSTENIIENQGLESVIEQGISLTGQAVSEISGEQEESQAQDENVNETIRTETAKTLVNYTAYDLDEDGYIDYVEWSVPHLSNQTYELVIEITKAEHLDENKSFVSDIYEQVKALDGNWSEEIPNEHYVRVTFERNLTKDRYITIYARAKDWNNESNSSISAEIEVYPENNDLMIAKFSGITSENWYKVYLNNLNETESYDVFELRVIGSVEFDYIVDPTAITNIEFISPTLASGSSTTNTSVEINVSIVANNISEVNFNWNVTNYTIYNDSLVLMYNFDNLSALGENATKVVDVSKYGNNGTVQNGSVACGQRADCPNWTTGKYGGAYHFDSINDRIDAGSGSSLDNLNNTGMTITLWAKFDTGYGEGGSLSMIATKSGTTTDPVGSWYFGIVPTGGSAGNLRFSKDTGASDLHRQSVQAVPINSWQYLTLTWTGANVSTGIIFYINGNETTYQLSTNGSATPVSDASNILYIGSDIYSGRTINGTLDELRIYNRVLSQDEIVELYMLNLQKYNQTQWYLYVNQSKNVTAGLDNATYTYFASAKDADGNENMTETRTIIIGGAAADTIYPTFSNYWDNNASLIISGTGLFNVTVLNTNGTVLLEINNTNMTATNITANVYNASYEFTENGTYSYKWHSWGNGTSKNYNVSDTRSYSVNSDTTAPLITIISPLNTTYSISSINFNISANENLSFCSVTLNNWVTNYTMTINATGTGANYTNTSIGDGSYTSKFWCNDSSGNINNTEQVTFAIDITLPAVLIVYPLNISYNINVSQLNYTSNGAYCWYSNGTGIWNSTPVTCGANFTNVISIEGSNTWTLYANDSSGNLNSSSVTFFKDTIYPKITIISPLNQTYTTTIINFSVSLNENSSWCGFSLDNSANITMTRFNDTYFNFTNSSMKQGSHSIVFACNDTSGNMNSSSGARVFSIDSIFPNVTLNAPANNANLTNTNVTFNCTSYDDTNLKNVSLYFNSTKGGSSTPTLIQNGTFGHTYNSPATTAPVNLSSLPTSNNLLITAIASDKSAGTYTVPSGFTLIATYSGSSVSGAMAYKISNGSEQNISWSYTTSQESSAWYAEYSGLSTTNVLDIVYENETFASADTTTSQINLRNSTDTSQANELAVAMFGIDTDGSVGTRSWSDGFTEVVFVDAPGTGTAGLGIANKSLSSIGIVNTTFSFTGGTADQMYAILATFKAASSGISWHANQTINISGIRNETIFNLNLTDNSTYSWNCYACDAVNNCNWSASNFTFNISVPIIISDISPNVTLTAPLNGATQSSLNVSFNFTAADDINLVNATLYFETINDITTTLYFQHDGSAVNNTEDAWINLTETNNTNYGSSANLSVDLSPSPEHTIIKFTGIFGTGNDQIPLGATITEANLTLYNEADPGNNAIIYILRENWTEGNVTWNNRTYNGTDWIAWTNQGAYGSTSSDTKINASTTLGTANAYSTSNVTAFVQNWSDGTDNFGFLIYPGGTSGITINSRDNTNVSRRPKLTVTYRTSANTPIAWHANKTISISGILNLTNITQTLLNNRTYSWNIRVCDNATTTCSFATSNFTLTINSSYVPACSEVNVSYFFDPYVMAWNETAEIIRLETNQPSNMTINYGTTTDYGLNISNTSFGTKNEFVLSGLTPDTLYYYRAIVVNDTGSACFQNSSFTSTFKTSNNSRTSFTFAVLADSRGAGCGDQGANFDNLINDIAGKGVDFVIMVGDDIQADAGGCTSHDSYWQGFHNITNIIRRNASFISSPGNHENLDGDSTARTSWRNYWIQPLNGNGSAGEWNETTFYWRYGNSLFISLNTIEIGNIGNITKSQLTWFNESAINQTGYTHKFVFTHYPIVGSNRAGTLSADNPPWSQTLDNMMFNNGVTAAFYGHNHLYCYNITQNGMLHITTGGAGSPLYANQCIGTEISQFHYVLINVTDNVINGTAYNLTGSIINSFSRTMTTTDTIYPLFSTYWDNNATLVNSGTGLFNVTLTNTNGTVWLEINNTNITAINITASVYNASYSFTNNGTYSYKWHSWGNGSSKNYNVSETRSYSVNSDTTAPLITIISPLNTTYVSSVINFSISSNENLSFCSVTLNNWVKNYTMTLNASLIGANYTNTSIGDGSYTSKFWCNDSSGNINNTEQVTFSIDTTPPSVSIIYPLNITYNINVSQLNYTSNGVYCWYSNGTGIWNSTPVTCGTNFTNVISIEGSNTWTLYANDSVGNLNSSSVTFSKDTNSPNITLLSPQDGSEDVDGIVDFNYNASDNSNISNCSLYIDDLLEQTDIFITKNVIQTFHIINVKSSDNLIWYINCTDSLNNKGKSLNRRLDTKLGGGGGAGGSGITQSDLVKYLGIKNISILLCNLTYDSASRSLNKYGEIFKIIRDYNLTQEWTEIKKYIDNWQSLCSDQLSKTLNPELVCENIYYFIIDNNYNHHMEEINGLRNKLKPSVVLSFDLLNYYIDDYFSLCYSEGYSKKLPAKQLPIIKVFSVVPTINESLITPCNASVGMSFFDWYIGIPQLFKIHVGEMSCNQLDLWRWVFKIRQETDNGEIKTHSLIGLKLWYLILILFGLLIYITIKTSRGGRKH